jgi:hypothetical protein
MNPRIERLDDSVRVEVQPIARSEDEFGHRRLLAEIAGRCHQSLRVSIDGIAEAVRHWCDGRLRDDVSLLAVERC